MTRGTPPAWVTYSPLLPLVPAAVQRPVPVRAAVLREVAAQRERWRRKPQRAPARAPQKQPKLLSGGNPQIAKGYGDAPVQAYIAAMPGWKRDVGRRLDALIDARRPGVLKAVKWNSPFYGVEEQALVPERSTASTRYVKVTFFRGASLRSAPARRVEEKDVRYLDIREDDVLDEAQFADWVKQASKLPGEKM